MRAAVLLAALLVGCYPDFQFGENGGAPGGTSTDESSSRVGVSSTNTDDGTGATSSAGGAGGQPQHTTTSSMNETNTGGGSTTSGTMPPPDTVPCGNGQGVLADCMPNEACCFSLAGPSGDHCEATTECGADDFDTFTCNAQADCESGICCAVFGEDIFGEYFDGKIRCESTCDPPSRRMCADASECQPGETCTQLFSNDYAPEYAQDYKFCG